jgi:hypothetical protein
LLISHRVKFVLIGGHAVAVHGHVRFTKDLDVLVEPSPANARRLREVLRRFGFGDAAPDEAVLATRGKVLMIGVAPYRIDVLTSASGVRFDAVWRTRVHVSTPAGRVAVISRELLITNKLAAGRPEDLRDVAKHEGLVSRRSTRRRRRPRRVER